jgi:hypothetical protein
MNKLILSLLFYIPVFGQDAPVIKLSKKIKASPTSVVKVYGYFDYHYKNVKGCDSSKTASIIQNNKISPCFQYLRSFEKNDAKKIINLLNDRSTYEGAIDKPCLETHYALLILNNNVVTGYVNMSLACNKIISDPAIPAASGTLTPKGKDELLHMLKLVTGELVAPSEN